MVTGDEIIASSHLVATQNELPVESEEQVMNPNEATIEKRMEYIMDQCNRFLGTKNILFCPTLLAYISVILTIWGNSSRKIKC